TVRQRPKAPNRCSHLLTIGKECSTQSQSALTPYLPRCLQAFMKTRKKVMPFPRSLIPANANQAPSFPSKQYGCVVFWCASPIKRICGDQTAAGFQRFTECGLGVRGFRPCTDHPCCGTRGLSHV